MRALLEQEENDALTRTHYPPSTSSRLSHPQKSTEHYHRQPAAEKRNDGYTVCPAQLDTAQVEAAHEADTPTFDDTVDALESWYNNGFLIGLWQAAAISKSRSGRCFNCQKDGHYWCQCKETLSPEPQELSNQIDREREEQKKRSLNTKGGHGSKGRPHPYTLSGSQPGATPGARGPCPVDDVSAGGSPYKYWNEDTLSRWFGPENLGWANLGVRSGRRMTFSRVRTASLSLSHLGYHQTPWPCSRNEDEMSRSASFGICGFQEAFPVGD